MGRRLFIQTNNDRQKTNLRRVRLFVIRLLDWYDRFFLPQG